MQVMSNLSFIEDIPTVAPNGDANTTGPNDTFVHPMLRDISTWEVVSLEASEEGFILGLCREKTNVSNLMWSSD